MTAWMLGERTLRGAHLAVLGAALSLGIAHCSADDTGVTAPLADAGADVDSPMDAGPGEASLLSDVNAPEPDSSGGSESDAGSCSGAASGCRPGEACRDGACTLVCPDTQTACGSVCSTTATDVANCGRCGHGCAAGLVCARGECTTSCGDLPSCGSGCADTRNDPANCGSCGLRCPTPPNGVPVCVAGQCGSVCVPGYADCNHVPLDGCETNLSNSPSSCGACGRACGGTAGNAAACINGACGVGQCSTGFENCDGNPANGCETDVRGGNPEHCGACGRQCSLPNTSVNYCYSSSCHVGSCAAGWGDCDFSGVNGCEARLDSNETCGSCYTRCGGGTSCTRRSSYPNDYACTCPAGLTACNGGCVDTASSDANCSECGRTCSPANATDAHCRASQCTRGTCMAGHDDCDKDAANGCEVHVTHDRKNCGGCGRSCAANEMCSAGTCTAAPPCATKTAPKVLVYHRIPETAFFDQLPQDAVVSVANDQNWTARSTADFAKYDLIVIADGLCQASELQSAYATRTIWSPAITGRIVVDAMSTYADYSRDTTAAVRKGSFAWLTSAPGTALYVIGDCAQRSMDYLSSFGTFSSAHTNGTRQVTEPSHPVLAFNPPLVGYPGAFAIRSPPEFDTIVGVRGSNESLLVVRDVACAAP